MVTTVPTIEDTFLEKIGFPDSRADRIGFLQHRGEWQSDKSDAEPAA